MYIAYTWYFYLNIEIQITCNYSSQDSTRNATQKLSHALSDWYKNDSKITENTSVHLKMIYQYESEL